MILKRAWVGGVLAALWVLVGCRAVVGPSAIPAEPLETAVATEITPPGTPSATSCLVISQRGVEWIKSCDGQTVPPYTTAMRDAACKDIIEFKAKEAFDENPSEPLGWTFGVNFNELANGQPLGCLRLYYRDENQGKYVAIDGGGILVDTCQIQGPGDLPVVDGQAHFCEDYQDKAVVCSVDLETWIGSRDTMNYVAAVAAPMTNEIADAITDFAPINHVHTYENMALVGVVGWPTGCDLHAGPMPLITYVPTQTAPLQPQLWLEVDGSTIGFPGACMSLHWQSNPALQVVTYDLHPLGTNPPVFRYAYQPAVTAAAQICPDPNVGNVVDLWEGPANLWIGAAPGEEAPGSFLGTIDGVLVDPFDSKPPGGE